MSKPAPRDVLDEMTHAELLAWVRGQFFRMPKRSELLYLRWEQQSAALLDAFAAENDALARIDTAARDRLAVQFSAATSAAERLRLLEQIEPYDAAIRAHIARYKKLNRRQAKVDRLYEQIDIERQKESRL